MTSFLSNENDAGATSDGRTRGADAPTRGSGTLDRVENERTAWLYVTAMHAAAVGGPRVPIRGIVEDVEDMRSQLTRERDEARARVAALEKRLTRRESLARAASAIRRGLARLGHRLRSPQRQRVAARGPLSSEDLEFIDEHVTAGRIFVGYGLVDRALSRFEAVVTRLKDSPGSPRTGDVPPTAPAAAGNRRTSLASLLLEEGMISPQQLAVAQSHLESHGGTLSGALRHLEFVTVEEIMAVLSVLHEVPSIDLWRFEIDPRVVAILPAETARQHRVLPLLVSGRRLTVAMADPGDEVALREVRLCTGCEVERLVADEAILEREIERYYSALCLRPEASTTPKDRRSLRLVWSREEPPRGEPAGGPPGVPAA